MVGRIEARLRELGVVLPAPAAPIANYVPYQVLGTLVIVSGQVPLVQGKIAFVGKLGDELAIEAGQQAARQCMINVLAQVKVATGEDLDRVRRVIRLGGFIACTAGFKRHADVMNGASDLAMAVFGDAGRHSRTTVGVASLPGDAAVEVEGMFEIAA